MIICKNNKAHESIKNQFKEKKITKEYVTFVIGKMKNDHGMINKNIIRHPTQKGIKMSVSKEEGKESITEYFVEKEWKIGDLWFSQLKLQLHTGRTHQIRVHLASEGTPIVGDAIYAKKLSNKLHLPHLLLTAKHLEFQHPTTDKRMIFDCNLPPHLQDFLSKLNDGKITAKSSN